MVVTMGCGDACPIFHRKRHEDWKLNDTTEIEADPPTQDAQAELLGMIPMLRTSLGSIPPELQRELFQAFRLEIRYDDRTNVAVLNMTLDSDTIEGVASMAEAIQTDQNGRLQEAPEDVDLKRAPCRIRTYAPGSGGGCRLRRHIPVDLGVYQLHMGK
ncbi:hypothetical protein [Spongiactinospora rosea]|uniref:hypothetical protein n=1 Tax=Spongiactinospora rosea TaxID=2248750 RepID=UPI0018F374E7|nr:hypothetical protein [Spongiactinospora rosea]